MRRVLPIFLFLFASPAFSALLPEYGINVRFVNQIFVVEPGGAVDVPLENWVHVMSTRTRVILLELKEENEKSDTILWIDDNIMAEIEKREGREYNLQKRMNLKKDIAVLERIRDEETAELNVRGANEMQAEIDKRQVEYDKYDARYQAARE